jgi:DNA-directed RNA polymerase specialized sigma24 family protein
MSNPKINRIEKGGNTFMVPAKIDSFSVITMKEKGAQSVLDWFEQHKQSLYTLGWCYLGNQQQMEELFYRSIIKVHKELPRFKSETSLETWITSIFIHTCRELSDNGRILTLEDKNFIHALGQLKELEKEAMILTYVTGFSHEETADLLQVSVEMVKEHLFSGIQSFRKEMGYGSTFNGCMEYHKDYIDYLDRTMDRAKKIDFEIHIYHCQACQEDLATFQDVMSTMINLTERVKDLEVPSDFIANIKDRIAREENDRKHKNKKRLKRGLIFTSVFVLLMGIGYFTGAFTNLYYSWTEEDQELRTFLKHDLGERLNLEAKSNGVDIKIKGVIADDVHTLIFYEIDDTKHKNQYWMNSDDGVLVENKYKLMMSNGTYINYYLPDLKSEKNNKKKNVLHGKISLPPLIKDNGTIKLRITKLQKLMRNSSNENSWEIYGDAKPKTGEWKFEIPVTKQPSIEYALDGKAKVEGVPVRFDKLTIAPTATILHIGMNNKHPEKRIENLDFESLKVNNQKVKADLYAGTTWNSQQNMDWDTFQVQFAPLFLVKPKVMELRFKSAILTINDPKTIELDASQEYPRTFKYAGSTISIDKVEIGQPAKVVISNHEIKNREYDTLHYNIVSESEMEPISMNMNSEGVLVDKNGEKYENTTRYEEIEQPRYLTTVESIEVLGNDSLEKVIPKKLEIQGYRTTKYFDDVVKITSKEQVNTR